MALNIQSWELKTAGVILVGIIAIIIIIWYSYVLSNKKQSMPEGFTTTYDSLVNRLNANRTNMIEINDAISQELVSVDPNASKYIDANKILTKDIKDSINSDFDIRFSQKLQDADLAQLNNSLNQLKLKMANLPATPTQYMLKNLGGAAFDMLGTPNDFSLRINPNEAKCLGFSPNDISIPNPTDNIYYSALSRQCDIGGSDKLQRFKLTQIKNNDDFNKLVGDLRSVPSYYNMNNYPFMVAQPVSGNIRQNGMLSECITFDNSGLSVEPCNGSENQRWHPYTVNN